MAAGEEEYLTLDSPFLEVIPYLDVEPCPEPGEALWFTPMRDLTRETFMWFAEGTREFLLEVARDPRYLPILWTARSTNGRKHKLFRLKGGGRLEQSGILPMGSSPDLDFEVSASVPIEDLFRSLGPFMETFAAYVYKARYGRYLTPIKPISWEPGTVQVAETRIYDSFAIRQFRNDTRGYQGIRVFATVNGYQDAILDFKSIATPGILYAYTLSQLLEQNFAAIQSRTAMISGAMQAYRSAIFNLAVLEPENIGPALKEELSARRSIGFNRIKVRNHYERFHALLDYAIEHIDRVPDAERAEFVSELQAVVIAFGQWLAAPERHQEFPSLEEIRAWSRVDPHARKTHIQILLEAIGILEDVGTPIIRGFHEAAKIPLRPREDPEITHATYELIVRKIVDPASVPKAVRMTAENLRAQREAAMSPAGRAFIETLRSRASPAAEPDVSVAGGSASRSANIPGFTRLPTATPMLFKASGVPKNL